MVIITDASVILAWLLPDEYNAYAGAVMAALEEDNMLVPPIWWWEVHNIVAINARRGRLPQSKVPELLSFIKQLNVLYDNAFRQDKTVSYAQKHLLSVYDASYLELAARTGHCLATLDKALIHAAEKETIPVFDGAVS